MGEVWERGWVVTIAQAGGSVEGVEVVKVGFARSGACAAHARAERPRPRVPVRGRGWNGGGRGIGRFNFAVMGVWEGRSRRLRPTVAHEGALCRGFRRPSES